jgi:hypothetical protein
MVDAISAYMVPGTECEGESLTLLHLGGKFGKMLMVDL